VLFDPRYDRLGDEFFDLWKEFTEREFLPDFPPVEALRVLPVEEVVRSTQILDIDRVRTIVRGARRLAVQRCPCRVRERRCDAPLEVCLSLDTLADYVLKRNLAREIDADEALAILTKSEDLGLVHQSTNSDHPDVICNCCPDCCVILRSVITHGKATAAVASRFRPVVDPAKCVDCLACVKACHFSAMVERDGKRAFDERCYGAASARACPHGRSSCAGSPPSRARTAAPQPLPRAAPVNGRERVGAWRTDTARCRWAAQQRTPRWRARSRRSAGPGNCVAGASSTPVPSWDGR
jgi:ferredoxin